MEHEVNYNIAVISTLVQPILVHRSWDFLLI